MKFFTVTMLCLFFFFQGKPSLAAVDKGGDLATPAVAFPCQEDSAVKKAFSFVSIENNNDYPEEFNIDCDTIKRLAQIANELNDMTKLKEKFNLEIVSVYNSVAYDRSEKRIYLMKYYEDLLQAKPELAADNTFHRDVMESFYVHEYGHHLVYNWVDEHLTHMYEKLDDQADLSNERMDNFVEVLQAKEKAFRLLKSYSELFSDIFELLYTDQPKLTSEFIKIVFKDNLRASTRDFTYDHDISIWQNCQEHARFAPIRSHFYKYIYKIDFTKKEKLKILKTLFHIMLKEMEKFSNEYDCWGYTDGDSSPMTIEMNESFVAALNKAFNIPVAEVKNPYF